MIKKTVTINGSMKTIVAEADVSLADVIREQFGLTGTKVGCGKGQCGSCSVIMNGKLVKSCITKMKSVPDAAEILTIEGVGTPGNLHPIQLAWTVHGAAQCGFCAPGFIVSAKALLDQNNNPTREEVREWFQKNRNACRCTGYKPIVNAVMDAAKVIRGEMTAKDLAFKLPEDGKIWGSNYPRPTAVAKATGTIDYGADVGLKMPAGTLRLALVQAKVSHAKILSIDTSEAEKMAGVEKVVTHKVSEEDSWVSLSEAYDGDAERASKLAAYNGSGQSVFPETGSGIRVPMTRRDIDRFEERLVAVKEYNRGLELASDGMYRDASERFREALKIDPSLSDASFNLAVAYQKLSLHKNAATVLKALLVKRRDNPDFHYALGVSYFHLRKYKNARKSFLDALALDDGHLKALFSLAVAYQKSGKDSEAERCWERYLEISGEGEWAEEARSRLKVLREKR